MAIMSNMIPRATWSATRNNSISGYAATMFSTFNTSDFTSDVAPLAESLTNSFENVTECSFIGYRQRQVHQDHNQVSYDLTDAFWSDTFSRCLFFVIFEVLQQIDIFKVLTKSLAFGSIMCLCNDLLYSGRAPWFEAESETSEVSDSRNHDQRRQTCEPVQASKFVKHLFDV